MSFPYLQIKTPTKSELVLLVGILFKIIVCVAIVNSFRLSGIKARMEESIALTVIEVLLIRNKQGGKKVGE